MRDCTLHRLPAHLARAHVRAVRDVPQDAGGFVWVSNFGLCQNGSHPPCNKSFISLIIDEGVMA